MRRFKLDVGGARRVPLSAEKQTAIATVWISQFKTPKGALGCFDAAKGMTLQGVQNADHALIGNDPKGRIDISRGVDPQGHIIPNPVAAMAAVEYINRMLNENRRVLVGVAYGKTSDDGPPEEAIGTRHYISIVGRSYERVESDNFYPAEPGVFRSRRVAYQFYDPGFFEESPNGTTGKLYIDDDTGVMFKQGKGKGDFLPAKDYEVTHVRCYR